MDAQERRRSRAPVLIATTVLGLILFSAVRREILLMNDASPFSAQKKSAGKCRPGSSRAGDFRSDESSSAGSSSKTAEHKPGEPPSARPALAPPVAPPEGVSDNADRLEAWLLALPDPELRQLIGSRDLDRWVGRILEGKGEERRDPDQTTLTDRFLFGLNARIRAIQDTE